jgi:hypothetical protein
MVSRAVFACTVHIPQVESDERVEAFLLSHLVDDDPLRWIGKCATRTRLVGR